MAAIQPRRQYVQALPIGSDSKRELEPDQKESHAHVLRCWEQHERAGLVCDAPGTGKTLTAIRAVEALVQRAQSRDTMWVLVVAPKQVADREWPNQLAQYNSLDKAWIVNHAATFKKERFSCEQPGDLSAANVVYVVTSCGLLLNDYKKFVRQAIANVGFEERVNLLPWLPRVKWHAIVIDEAHELRNCDSMKHHLVEYFVSRSEHKVLLTGTPFNNEVADVCSLFSLLRVPMPQVLAEEVDDSDEDLKSNTAEDSVAEFLKLLHPATVYHELEATALGALARDVSDDSGKYDHLFENEEITRMALFEDMAVVSLALLLLNLGLGLPERAVLPAVMYDVTSLPVESVKGLQGYHRNAHKWHRLGQILTAKIAKGGLDDNTGSAWKELLSRLAIRHRLDLPLVSTTVHHVQLQPSAIERQNYLTVLGLLEQEREKNQPVLILALLGQLSRCLSHASLIHGKKGLVRHLQSAASGLDLHAAHDACWYAESTKFSWIINHLLATLEDNTRTVIVSTWTADLDLLYAALTRQFDGSQLHVLRIDGRCASYQTTADEMATQFNSTESTRRTVLLLNIESGGVGLNLQSGSEMIFLNVHWNPAKVTQAIGRIFRRGQTAAQLQIYFLWIVFGAAEHALIVDNDLDVSHKPFSVEIMVLNAIKEKLAGLQSLMSDNYMAETLYCAASPKRELYKQCDELINAGPVIAGCPCSQPIRPARWCPASLKSWSEANAPLLLPSIGTRKRSALSIDDASSVGAESASAAGSSCSASELAGESAVCKSSLADCDEDDDVVLLPTPTKRRVPACASADHRAKRSRAQADESDSTDEDDEELLSTSDSSEESDDSDDTFVGDIDDDDSSAQKLDDDDDEEDDKEDGEDSNDDSDNDDSNSTEDSEVIVLDSEPEDSSSDDDSSGVVFLYQSPAPRRRPVAQRRRQRPIPRRRLTRVIDLT